MLAWACIILAAAGVVLPILPTTPFLLVAAWAAPRASPRLDSWLVGHPRFGPILRAWREEGAVPTRAKRIAWALLLVSWTTMAFTAEAAWVPWATAPFFIAVGIFVGTRTRPLSEAPAGKGSAYPRQ